MSCEVKETDSGKNIGRVWVGGWGGEGEVID